MNKMDKEQEFRIYCSDITKSLDPDYTVDDKTTPLILEGIASTSDIDLEGDYITPQCIESFKLQATQCNIHNNHNVGLDDVIGTVLEVLDSDSKTLKIKFSILPLFRKHIEECIDNGVKLGLSIGGTIIDYDSTDEGLKINSMMLHEISLTPLPANWNTMGTVTASEKSMDEVIEAKCLNGVCKQFLNKIEKTTEQEKMETEKRYYTKDEEAQFMSEDRVVELINEALNNFATNSVTEEKVAEIIDEKLRGFVEQAKAIEKEEQEKLKEEEEKKKKAQAKKAEKEENEKLIADLTARIEELEEQLKRKTSKAKKDEEPPEEPAEEEPENPEPADEEEEEPKEKEGKKSAITDLTPEDLGSLIAQAVQMTNKNLEPEEPTIDITAEIQTLREDLSKEINKAMNNTKQDIEKSLFDGLMKSKPSSKSDNAQIRKFLKTKNEQNQEKANTLNVQDIAKTLARKE